LFNVPGSDARKVSKVLGLDVDTIVFDFEDGVSLNKKQEARDIVCETLAKNTFGRSERAVRINSVGSEFYDDDLKAIQKVLGNIDAILLPKVEDAAQINAIAKFLDKAGEMEHYHTKILGGIESAHAILNLKEICSASSRLDALVFGSEDYGADVGTTRTSDGDELLLARSQIVTYAAAYNLAPIDMVCVQYKDLVQLKKECIQGYNMGFVGKQAIHPDQIKPIYDHFRPPDNAIEFAKRILKENEKNQHKGKGAWEIDGKMIDMPMVRWAQNTLQKANIQYSPGKE